MAIYGIEAHNWQSSYLNIQRPSKICYKSDFMRLTTTWRNWSRLQHKTLTGFLLCLESRVSATPNVNFRSRSGKKSLRKIKNETEIESRIYCAASRLKLFFRFEQLQLFKKTHKSRAVGIFGEVYEDCIRDTPEPICISRIQCKLRKLLHNRLGKLEVRTQREVPESSNFSQSTYATRRQTITRRYFNVEQ